jgi:hypothetical protein
VGQAEAIPTSRNRPIRAEIILRMDHLSVLGVEELKATFPDVLSGAWYSMCDKILLRSKGDGILPWHKDP